MQLACLPRVMSALGRLPLSPRRRGSRSVTPVDGLPERERGSQGGRRRLVSRSQRGETLGLVGESGCGKSTTGLAHAACAGRAGAAASCSRATTSRASASARCAPSAAGCRWSSRIRSARSIRACGRRASSPSRSRSTAARPQSRAARALIELLQTVGLPRRHDRPLPARVLRRTAPAHRHRAGARARAATSSICDEPVSALDVSIQAQVVNLLRGSQDNSASRCIFITHDLAVVRHVATGRRDVSRHASSRSRSRDELYAAPQHPYTQALMAAIRCPIRLVEATRAHRSSRARCRVRRGRRRAAVPSALPACDAGLPGAAAGAQRKGHSSVVLPHLSGGEVPGA